MTSCAKPARSIKPAGKEDANLSAKQFLFSLYFPISDAERPAYLADSLRLTSEVAARRRLRSVDSPTMLVSSTHRSTLCDCAFPVAAVRAWNSLPSQTRAASSLLTFQRETKSHLFRQSLG